MNQDIIVEGETCWRLCEADQMSVLVDADAYYQAFCRAALCARHRIYISGWQFDTKAVLARPEPEHPPSHPIELLPFLNYLCEQTPDLHIYITAWDYSLVYAIEREWLQKLKFDFQSHERVRFEFTNHPDPGGCYHRKLVVIDNRVAFLGGLDLCDSRWDERRHVKHDPRRVDLKGRPYKPFHDVQVALRGPVTRAALRIFLDDWRRTTGEDLEPPPSSALISSVPAAPQAMWAEPGAMEASASAPHYDERAPAQPDEGDTFDLQRLSGGLGVRLRGGRVALCRTECDAEGRLEHGEIQHLFERALSAAEHLVYIETQYFTSKALAEALCMRLADDKRSKLQVVLVMPDGADSPKEDFVLGNRQRAVRKLIAEFARRNGHEFRLLMSSESTPDDPSPATFIHSKLLIVDDQFLSIGSANFTNRSMRVDGELNAAWETRLEPPERAAELEADIRALRASLLAEHSGTHDAAFFEPMHEMIQRIDQACATRGGKLHCQGLPDPQDDNPLLIAIFDPSGPLDWETLDQSLEEAFDSDEGFVKKTAQKIGQRLGVIDVD